MQSVGWRAAPGRIILLPPSSIPKPVKLRGTVTKMEWINPHSWIHIDVKGPDGKVVSWMVEGGSPNALLRRGFTKAALPAGTEIVIEGYQAKDGPPRQRPGHHVRRWQEVVPGFKS